MSGGATEIEPVSVVEQSSEEEIVAEQLPSFYRFATILSQKYSIWLP